MHQEVLEVQLVQGDRVVLVVPWDHLVQEVLEVPLDHPYLGGRGVEVEEVGEGVVVAVVVVVELDYNMLPYNAGRNFRDILADTDWDFFCSAEDVLQQQQQQQKRMKRITVLYISLLLN